MTKNTTNEKVKMVYEELAEKSEDGGVTSQALLNASRAKDAPLHNRFDWNNTSAGEKYRLKQAGKLLREMTIMVNEERTREYQNIIIEVDQQKVHKYYHIETIMSSEELKKKVLTQIAKKMREMMETYKQYKEIYKVVNEAELEKLEKKIKD